jgi:hypothetical protein
MIHRSPRGAAAANSNGGDVLLKNGEDTTERKNI